jgi:site-specific recombinase XerD
MERTVLYPIKPGCYKPRRDGTSNIHIQYCYTVEKNEKKTLLDTEIVIPINCWEKENLFITPDLPRQYGSAKKLNETLDSQLRLVEDIITYATKKNIVDKGSFVKTFYKPDLDIYCLSELVHKKEEERKKQEEEQKGVDLDVFNQIDAYIKSKKKKVCKDMPRIWRNMKDHLLTYQEARAIKITFESFTLDFYEDFVDFLSHEYIQKRRKQKIVGLKINTVGKTVNHLRGFLINRSKKKIIPTVDLTDWDVVGEETDAEYLNWSEIEKMWTVDLSEYPHLIPYRADFVLGCLTGLRFSDFSKLEKPDVRGDFLYKKQGKSRHWVVIPLRRAAREILENRFKDDYKPLTNAEFNRHIKTVAKLASIDEPIKHSYRKGNNWFDEVKPKYEWITSHTCRRSFCTNEFLAGTPVELIMKISGHKSTKDFYRYIRITPEQAAQIMKEIWEKRIEVGKTCFQAFQMTNQS